MQKQQRAPFGLRMPDDLKNWIKATAQAECRSVNNLIVHLLERARAAAGDEIGVQPPAAQDTQEKGSPE